MGLNLLPLWLWRITLEIMQCRCITISEHSNDLGIEKECCMMGFTVGPIEQWSWELSALIVYQGSWQFGKRGQLIANSRICCRQLDLSLPWNYLWQLHAYIRLGQTAKRAWLALKAKLRNNFFIDLSHHCTRVSPSGWPIDPSSDQVRYSPMSPIEVEWI